MYLVNRNLQTFDDGSGMIWMEWIFEMWHVPIIIPYPGCDGHVINQVNAIQVHSGFSIHFEENVPFITFSR